MERPKPSRMPLSAVTEFIQSSIPKDIIPSFYAGEEASIFQSLEKVSQVCPNLTGLVEGIYKKEVEEIITSYPDQIEIITRRNLNEMIRTLSPLKTITFHPQRLGKDEIFQLNHDMSSPLMRFFGKGIENMPKSYMTFYHLFHLFSELRYRYANEERNKVLTLNYSDLLRKFCEHGLVPCLNEAVKDPVPFGNYELYEARSAFREVAQISPKRYAETFPLLTEVNNFVRDREFHDKNMQKPVRVIFDSESTNPHVFMDKGDLFRMMRNLLRDAVVHSGASVLQPIIKIEETPECTYLSVFSEGVLEQRVLQTIGRKPYTTQDRGEVPHGYGKVGARKLLEALWKSIGATPWKLNRLMNNHWSNVDYNGTPHIRWKAPIPYAI